jgi:hypothetical protein
VNGAALHARRIEQPASRSRTTLDPNPAIRSGRARCAISADFDQALKIDREIVAFGGAARLSCAATSPGCIPPEDHDAIDEAVAFEQRNPARLHHPGDARPGKLCLSDAAPGRA